MTEVLNIHWVGGEKPIGMGPEATENAHYILAPDLLPTYTSPSTPTTLHQHLASLYSPRALTLDFLGNSGLMGGCGEGDDALQLGMVNSKMSNDRPYWIVVIARRVI